LVGTLTPYTTRPRIVTATTTSTATTMAVRTRPARYTHGGRGVLRTRFSNPFSRRMVNVMARLTRVAETMARATMPGT
jgi:hypothetical protein